MCVMILNYLVRKSMYIGLYKTPNKALSCLVFSRLVSPGGGAFANFALPESRAFAKPGANLKLLKRTRFPIRI